MGVTAVTLFWTTSVTIFETPMPAAICVAALTKGRYAVIITLLELGFIIRHVYPTILSVPAAKRGARASISSCDIAFSSAVVMVSGSSTTGLGNSVTVAPLLIAVPASSTIAAGTMPLMNSIAA